MIVAEMDAALKINIIMGRGGRELLGFQGWGWGLLEGVASKGVNQRETGVEQFMGA